MANTSYDTQQVLNSVLNLTLDALRVEGESSPEVLEKLNTIISLMGGSSTEKTTFTHDLQASAFEEIISPDSNWTPKFLGLTFSTTEERTVEIKLRYGTDDFLIRSFIESQEQKETLSTWFSDYGIAPFIDSDMSIVISISQTTGPCTVTGLMTHDEILPTV